MICLVALAAILYLRGWGLLHRQAPYRFTPERRAAYLAGLGVLWIALASPLDAFGNFLLEAHMVQHLLLILIAPPLILMGQPVLPILRGLPRVILKDGLGPFLRWRVLRRIGRLLTHPLASWSALTAAIVFWHVPRWFELALRSNTWHGVEHACFFYGAILFWWPVVQVWPSRPQWPRWMLIPYLVFADIVNTALSAWLVFSTHVVYQAYALAPRLGGVSALDDQSTAGAIMWVPGSFAYLIPALALAMQALNGPRIQPRLVRIEVAPRRDARRSWDLLRLPALGPILRHRSFRPLIQFILFALAMAVVIDGFFGPQIAPMNLAGVLPWTYWRGFAVIALLAGGNLFCMACPFMLPRNLGRRLLPARRRWPRMLRSKWLGVALLVTYFWVYEVFRLWSSPWWTAWIVVGYFVTAFVVDGWFRGASFCKYVCPIGQFHFLNSLVSPLQVKVRSEALCSSCHTHDCIRGNAAQRGCELHLFQPRKHGNFDCTFCLDCVHACPHDNVGILTNPPGSALFRNDGVDRHSSGIGKLSARPDAAALAWVLIFGALSNAAAMVDPVMQWMHSLQVVFGLRSMLPVTTVVLILGIVAVPLLLARICGAAAAWLGRVDDSSRRRLARSFAFALVPLGFSMWVAHFSFHLIAGWRSLAPVVDRILGRSAPLMIDVLPAWLPALQILLLDAGLVLSVYAAWRTAHRHVPEMSRALRLMTPWAILAMTLYAASVWVLFQPMQMRGMVM